MKPKIYVSTNVVLVFIRAKYKFEMLDEMSNYNYYVVIVISHTFTFCRANILRMEPGTTPPPNQQSPLHPTPDHSFPEYATISEANLSVEPPGGVGATPNPSYGTSLSISRPHPSAEPGSGMVCPNPSYAVPSLTKQ